MSAEVQTAGVAALRVQAPELAVQRADDETRGGRVAADHVAWHCPRPRQLAVACIERHQRLKVSGQKAIRSEMRALAEERRRVDASLGARPHVELWQRLARIEPARLTR